MRCSTIITCELLNYTVQRQMNGQATEYTAIQSDADKQVMTDKLVRNSIKSKQVENDVCLIHNSVFITIQVVYATTN